MGRRDYGPLIARAMDGSGGGRSAAMALLCDWVWEAFGQGQPERPAYSWIGFYEKVAGRDEMVLVARRDKPACSPIGLHGMCGRGWSERRPILVDDVATLGTNYIACDPKDRSEVVIPLIDESGACWGVLDGDSHEPSAFDEADVHGLTRLAGSLGLSHPGPGEEIAARGIRRL